jgi:iron(III) transport system permease protein
LLQSFFNSVWVSALVTLLTVPLAFGFAYAMARSCIPGRGVFHHRPDPLLAPSLLSALSLIYCRQQGIAKASSPPRASRTSTARRHRHRRMLRGVPACADPVSALALAGPALRGGAGARHPTRRKFFTITLPGAKYGLISAALVAFTLVMTDIEGDRQQLQHARHRRLQAGDQAAGLPARRGGRPAAAGRRRC